MEILVLGSGCANCHTLEERTAAALARLGWEASIGHVREPDEIASYGVMRTPGLVVDGDVVVAGRVPTVEALVALLEGARG